MFSKEKFGARLLEARKRSNETQTDLANCIETTKSHVSEMENGKKTADIAACFDYKRKEFRLTNAQRYAKGLPTAALRESLAALIEVDEKMKSTPCDKQVLLQELIVKLMLLAKKEYDVG